ncbi:Receptor-type guanylate cyclase gcy-17 [Caenorhabditis elegans]|uniref:Isoform b of Receptor-type guanylate cyclase gcy-17 n=1 Tax=Caenorhabditis elegans TaxID=6239 RepID=X5M8U1-2|nr:Receptor-type guanylate cyclase gcy-17 [Caenorhabditis elegans]CDO41085.1 Receptor-type guanylate cyclase gcy-17 [Caenorhabditis elegans]|eukprot:NP_001293328.1 Receptor-type guanylate cyclase gcy-17 [Caenorhabditis elegans]
MLFLRLFIFTPFLILANCQARRTIKVGLLFVQNVSSLQVGIGYRTSAAAVLVTKNKIREDHVLDGFDFEFLWDFDECNEILGAGKTVDLLEVKKVDVIFGPTCSRPALISSALATYYNIPIFEWGLTSTRQLTDVKRFPTTLPFSVNSYSLAMAILGTLKQFQWTEFVFLYCNDGDDEKCESLKDDVQTVASAHEELSLAYTFRIQSKKLEDMRAAIVEIKKRGRIIVACVASGNGSKRTLMQAVALENANNSEYVYIMAETNSRGFVVEEVGGKWHYLWEGKFDDSDTFSTEDSRTSMANLLFLVDNMGMNNVVTPQYLNFSKNVIEMMKDEPFNCVEDCVGEEYSSVAKYAGQLADAFYAYAVAVNRLLTANPQAEIRNGTMILRNIGMTFEGVGGGDLTVDPDSARTSEIIMIGLNSSRLPETYGKLIINNQSVHFEQLYSDEVMDVWNGRQRPKAKPTCGFTGTQCPPDFVRDYLVIVIIIVMFLIFAVSAAVGAVFYAIRQKRKEIERQDELWHVEASHLKPISKKSKSEASQRSFASGPSTSTKLTVESRTETTRFIFYIYQNEVVAANKHDFRPQLTDVERSELRQMRSLDHDNLNKFIGLCLNSQQLLSIWRYCSRGSLADVISRSSMQMDSFFMLSLIRDIANGLGFIHTSMLHFHGYLSSRSCLIDDRWQVKISDFGLNEVRGMDKLSTENMLWWAPEVLRGLEQRSKEADIYSFGIICSEVITRSSAFDLENRKEKPEEIIYQLKKGGFNAIRPSLLTDEALEINPALVHLIRDCWTEKPSERPPIDQVRSLLRGMNDGKKGNLMDHVFNMLETYASTLEEEVNERTKELVEEQKKSDVLLYRMLPKTVAEKLKAGISIEPETFELVTIFFSDVVQFTTLASKCTPLQVVQLLNDLYTIFDSIIEQNDVYKVETIGDGYLCVSGLPHRNGHDHIKHIARMSLAFLSSLAEFRVAHMPSERINLRIGINCGSVVAGVVGLTMPRYCLFGDAVNTASRMESNGKPGRIHVSSEANHLLTHVVGGFRTEERGEVIIKGKGVMNTYWLLGENDSVPVKSNMRKRENTPSMARSITPEI